LLREHHLDHAAAISDVRGADEAHRGEAQPRRDRLSGDRHQSRGGPRRDPHPDRREGPQDQVARDHAPDHRAAERDDRPVDEHLRARAEALDLVGGQPELPVDGGNELREERDVGREIEAGQRHEHRAGRGERPSSNHLPAASDDRVELAGVAREAQELTGRHRVGIGERSPLFALRARARRLTFARRRRFP